MEIHACQRSSALHPLETYDLASGFMCAVLLESNTTASCWRATRRSLSSEQQVFLSKSAGEVQAERGETTGSKIMFSLSRLKRSEWIPVFFNLYDKS